MFSLSVVWRTFHAMPSYWVWAMLWLYPIASILSVAWAIAAWAFLAGFPLISLGIRLKRLQAAENGLESRTDETK
jgi:hypothetical protein